MKQKVLIVDDEPSIITLLRFNLEKEGFEVKSATDGQEALQLALHEIFAFILLDWMLPKLDGPEVIKELRKQHIDTPIIMLTAKEDTIDRIIGLELGADDYVTKPFSPREVLARMKAIQRRLPKETTATYLQNGPLKVNKTTKEVYLGEQALVLRKKEFDLLVYFLEHQNEVLSREQLLKDVWHTDFMGESRMVDMHVSLLREKLEADSKNPQFLQTVRGIGYQMVTVHD